MEIIEAKWLFDTPVEKINVVIHPQSIIHSMVEFPDGAVIAQMGCPDMREPIQYALTYPERLPLNNRKIDFAALGTIEFHAPDKDKFPAIDIAYRAVCKEGNMPCIMNAANEVAVNAFLENRIKFYDITDIVSECMAAVDFVAEPDIETIFMTDEVAKAKAEEITDSLVKR